MPPRARTAAPSPEPAPAPPVPALWRVLRAFDAYDVDQVVELPDDQRAQTLMAIGLLEREV